MMRRKCRPARFDPAGLTHEVAALLSSILREAECECAKRIPQSGGNRWYSEPIRLATYAAGTSIAGKSRRASIYSDMLKRDKGASPVILFDLFFSIAALVAKGSARRLMKMNWTFWRKAEFSAFPGSRSKV